MLLLHTRQDKTNFISQKDHKATYIATKEYSTYCDTLIELQQYALHKNNLQNLIKTLVVSECLKSL